MWIKPWHTSHSSVSAAWATVAGRYREAHAPDDDEGKMIEIVSRARA